VSRPPAGDPLAAYIDNFRRRVLEDALHEATPIYWRRRAEAFAGAQPRLHDYPGRATAADVEQQRLRLAEVELACRRRAHFALLSGEEW